MLQASSIVASGQGEQPDTSRSAVLLRLERIGHRYGRTQAVRACNFDVRPGEIHGLVGENGSGKSTIVKILSGVVRPSEGSLLWQGKPLVLRSPKAAQTNGIVTVFQETLVVDEMRGQDNVFLGQDGLFSRHAGFRRERAAATELLRTLGYDSAMLNRPAYMLTIGERQIITLARALARPWKLLILDEATSALDLQTRDRLFEIVESAVKTGSAVLFVSHRMDELHRLIDRSTVLRSGLTVATVERAEASTALYLQFMSGREHPLEAGVSHTTAERAAPGGDGSDQRARTLVRCQGLSIGQSGTPFDLEVRSGEVLGIAGLEGHGGARFVSCLAGVERPAAGEVQVLEGHHFKRIGSYRQAFASGVIYVPGNRQTEGLFAPLAVIDNLAVAVLNRLSKFGFFSPAAPRRVTQEYVARLGIEAPDIGDPVSSLSGGNQQKVLVGRWLAAKPSVLVMNDPLRGVDQGTKNDFYQLLRQLAQSGAAVVALSTEIEELLTVCDRVAVFHNQTLWRTLDRQHLTYDEILQAMFGQPGTAAGAPTN